MDEYGKDQGANVRQKAKDITNLLQDESRLRQERRSRANMRDRMVRGGPGGEDTPEDENTHRRSRSTPAGSRHNREDDEFQKALEASKRTAELEAQETALSAECVDPLCPGPICHLFFNAFTGSVISSAPSSCLRRKRQNAPTRLRRQIPNPYLKTALHKQCTSYPNL